MSGRRNINGAPSISYSMLWSDTKKTELDKDLNLKYLVSFTFSAVCSLPNPIVGFFIAREVRNFSGSVANNF